MSITQAELQVRPLMPGRPSCWPHLGWEVFSGLGQASELHWAPAVAAGSYPFFPTVSIASTHQLRSKHMFSLTLHLELTPSWQASTDVSNLCAPSSS